MQESYSSKFTKENNVKGLTYGSRGLQIAFLVIFNPISKAALWNTISYIIEIFSNNSVEKLIMI